MIKRVARRRGQGEIAAIEDIDFWFWRIEDFVVFI